MSGAVVVRSQGQTAHNGIQLTVEGTAALQLSARSVGLFEAFYSSLKPIQLLSYQIEITPAGKVPNGTVEFPFEFTLKANQGQQLYDTYHGVYVNIQYMITAEMARPMLAKNYVKAVEFTVETEVKRHHMCDVRSGCLRMSDVVHGINAL